MSVTLIKFKKRGRASELGGTIIALGNRGEINFRMPCPLLSKRPTARPTESVDDSREMDSQVRHP